jgi:hypothetical protein
MSFGARFVANFSSAKHTTALCVLTRTPQAISATAVTGLMFGRNISLTVSSTTEEKHCLTGRQSAPTSPRSPDWVVISRAQPIHRQEIWSCGEVYRASRTSSWALPPGLKLWVIESFAGRVRSGDTRIGLSFHNSVVDYFHVRRQRRVDGRAGDRPMASPRSPGCRGPCWPGRSRRRGAACADGP